MRTKNLKFRSSWMSYWLLANTTVDDDFQWQITKQKRGLRIKGQACPANAGLYTAFRHSFSFETLLVANFGYNRFMQEVVSKLALTAIWICCAVLLESDQTPFSRTRVNIDLLLCTGFYLGPAEFFLGFVFQRSMNKRITEPSNEDNDWNNDLRRYCIFLQKGRYFT